MIAEKVKEIVKGNIFKSGERYFLLCRTDRKYNKAKAPDYYLSEKVRGKFVYLSGLFATKSENVFSYDVKDCYGLKIMKRLRLGRDCIDFID